MSFKKFECSCGFVRRLCCRLFPSLCELSLCQEHLVKKNATISCQKCLQILLDKESDQQEENSRKIPLEDSYDEESVGCLFEESAKLSEVLKNLTIHIKILNDKKEAYILEQDAHFESMKQLIDQREAKLSFLDEISFEIVKVQCAQMKREITRHKTAFLENIKKITSHYSKINPLAGMQRFDEYCRDPIKNKKACKFYNHQTKLILKYIEKIVLIEYDFKRNQFIPSTDNYTIGKLDLFTDFTQTLDQNVVNLVKFDHGTQSDAEITMWNLNTNYEFTRFIDRYNCFTFFGKNKFITGDNLFVHIWDLKSFERLESFRCNHGFRDIKLINNETQLLCTTAKKGVNLIFILSLMGLDLRGDIFVDFWTKVGLITYFDVLPTGNIIYCDDLIRMITSIDGEWKRRKNEKLDITIKQRPLEFELTCLKVLDRENFFATGNGKTISIWDRLEVINTLQGHTLRVVCLEHTPNNPNHLISCSSDTTIRLWDWTTAQSIHIFEIPTGKLYINREKAIKLNTHNPNELISGSCEGIKVWDISTGKLLSVIKSIGNVDEIVMFPSDEAICKKKPAFRKSHSFILESLQKDSNFGYIDKKRYSYNIQKKS